MIALGVRVRIKVMVDSKVRVMVSRLLGQISSSTLTTY